MTTKRDAHKGKQGLSLVARLDAWARAFAQRPDVKVGEHKRGKAWKSADSAIYAGSEILAFYTEANGYTLEWSLRNDPEEVSRVGIPSYTTTQVVFHPFKPAGGFTAKFADAMLLDSFANKNMTAAALPKASSKTATIISLFTGRTFDSFEAYMTEGARTAFAKGWQWGSAETRATLPWFPEGNRSWEPAARLRNRLSENSLPEDAPLAQIAERLEQRGLSAEESQALIGWLGVDARLAAG